MANVKTNSTRTKKVTFSDVLKKRNIELLSFIDKEQLVKDQVVFCITKVEKVDVPNSKFDIKEQWQLTIVTPVEDDTIRKFWLTFLPNEIRNDHFTALQEELEQGQKEGLQAVHSFKLEAIPVSQYENGRYYRLINTELECHCGMDV